MSSDVVDPDILNMMVIDTSIFTDAATGEAIDEELKSLLEQGIPIQKQYL